MQNDIKITSVATYLPHLAVRQLFTFWNCHTALDVKQCILMPLHIVDHTKMPLLKNKTLCHFVFVTFMFVPLLYACSHVRIPTSLIVIFSSVSVILKWFHMQNKPVHRAVCVLLELRLYQHSLIECCLLDFTGGRVIAQVVSPLLPTAAARVW